MRWSPVLTPQAKLTFVTGLQTITAGDAETLTGMASHLLFTTKSMTRQHICNSDGEFLIVAQQGQIRSRHHRLDSDRSASSDHLKMTPQQKGALAVCAGSKRVQAVGG